MADYVRELDQRELREQVRDWAVVGTLTRLGATPRQLASATYQMPPARLAYLDELFAFEYGSGRRAYLGNRVLLFRDNDDRDPQATLGRLADRVRMENGELPATVEIYLIDDRRDAGLVEVQRAGDVSRDDLLSAAYGYVEGRVGSTGELAAWLARVDDVTFVRVADDGRLVLGGRRFAATPAANIAVEDVAALYQAHEMLEPGRSAALALIDAQTPAVRASIARYTALMGAPGTRAASRDQALAAIWRAVPAADRVPLLRAVALTTKKGLSPGFSLDPEWLPDPDDPDHPLVVARIRAFAADPCGDLARTAARARELTAAEPDDARRSTHTVLAETVRNEIESVDLEHRGDELCPRLKDLFAPGLTALARTLSSVTMASAHSGMVPFYEYLEALGHIDPGDSEATLAVRLGLVNLVWQNLRFHEKDTQVIAARYEGVTGTRVGMTLFYTDLLAKLWLSTDFAHSAPSLAIPGFRSEPQLDISAVYEREFREHPSGRIWFGPLPSAVSRMGSDARPAFLFAHRFSRIYAASNNPAQPELESPPDEELRRALSWWERHFDEIAAYEPEYQRQNQIMKWSLITAALSRTSLGRALAELSVARDFTFREWQSAHKDTLRFGEALPDVEQCFDGRECIPWLNSYVFQRFGQGWSIAGGVSTTPLEAPRAVPAVNRAKAWGDRVAPVGDLGAGTAGPASRARAVLSGGKVTFKNSALARTRTVARDIPIGTPKMEYVPGTARDAVTIRAGDGRTAIGELHTQRVRDRVNLQWREGPIERARLHKLEPGKPGLVTADGAAKQGSVVDAANIYERGLPGELPAAERLAREAIVDIAHRRPAAVAAKLERLAADGKALSPQARASLVGALRRDSSALARRVDTVLRSGEPLNNARTSVVVERGRVIVTRDIEQLPRQGAPDPTTDLSRGAVFVDTRLRVGQEGLLPEVGGTAARWTRQRGVKLVELRASEIGELPDRMVETSTGTVFEHAETSAAVLALGASVFLLQQCDANQSTATTSDDC